MIKIIKRKASPISLSIALICLSVSILFHAYYPGQYTNGDTVSQFSQAINNSYKMWHPPLMAWTWSILLKMTNLTASMLIFHTLLLFVSAICWTFVFNKLLGFRFSLAIPLLIISPIINSVFGQVLKDAGFAYYMLLACGVLALGIVKKKISILLLITIFCLSFLALGTRSNGLFAIIPIIFLSFWFFFEKTKWKTLKSVTITGIVMLGILFCLHIFNYYILNAEKCYTFQYTQRQDLILISVISEKNYFPESLKILWKRTKNKNFKQSGKFVVPFDDVIAYPVCGQSYDIQKQLNYAWIVSIVENPVLYLKLRWKMFKATIENFSFVGFNLFKRKAKNKTVRQMKDLSMSANLNFGNSFKGLNITQSCIIIFTLFCIAGHRIAYFFTGGWFWPMLLLSELVIGLFIVQDKRLKTIILLLSSSGILYLLPYYIVIPLPGSRYLYWSIISGSFCFFFVIGSSLKKFKYL